MTVHDVVIIGGGIVGTSVAWQLRNVWPKADMLLIEKESEVAFHQSRRSSGVVHAGIYYQPGSLKATFCREGVKADLWFAKEYGIPLEQCGKLVVATDDFELERMHALFDRARENGIDVEKLDAVDLKEREPRITGKGAILSPTTGITDYLAFSRTYAHLFEGNHGNIRTGTTVHDLVEEADEIRIVTNGPDIRTRFVIVCGGLQADRLAGMMGLADDFRVVPFRGEYFALGPDKNDIVNHLIYPVPDPALPFLGVHLTRMIDGGVTLGPNAVFSLAREAYSGNYPSFRDLTSSLCWGGTWRLGAKYASSAIGELRSSLSRRRYLDLCRKYCPELALSDLNPHPTGIRAQAVSRDGDLIHDFIIKSSKRSLHVCNAPSPAATSSMPIGRHIIEQANERFDLGIDLGKPVWHR